MLFSFIYLMSYTDILLKDQTLPNRIFVPNLLRFIHIYFLLYIFTLKCHFTKEIKRKLFHSSSAGGLQQINYKQRLQYINLDDLFYTVMKCYCHMLCSHTLNCIENCLLELASQNDSSQLFHQNSCLEEIFCFDAYKKVP